MSLNQLDYKKGKVHRGKHSSEPQKSHTTDEFVKKNGGLVVTTVSLEWPNLSVHHYTDGGNRWAMPPYCMINACNKRTRFFK